MKKTKLKDPGNTLAALFHRILFENGVSPNVLEEMISVHTEKLKRSNVSGVNIGSYKGNLKKELFTNKMSWKTFIKGLKVINPLKVTFTVTIRFRTKETIHSVELDLSGDVDDIK